MQRMAGRMRETALFRRNLTKQKVFGPLSICQHLLGSFT
jgi:hypothetical protein